MWKNLFQKKKLTINSKFNPVIFFFTFSNHKNIILVFSMVQWLRDRNQMT